jgi:peptidoglycan/LPS O-acetylase OafA/YrhL
MMAAPARKRFYALDGMRGVCAIMVFLFHLIPLHSNVSAIAHGYIAVDAFFVISGFVIAASYESRIREGMSVASFALARIRRLGPTYWFGLVLGALSWIGILMLSNYANVGTTIPAIFIALVLESFLIPYVGGSLNSFALNDPSWSIFGEFVVNILYASTLKWLSSVRLAVIVFAGWGFTLWFAWFSSRGWDFGWSGETILVSPLRAAPAFAAGILLYRLWANGLLSWLPGVPAIVPMGVWCGLVILPRSISPLLVDAISVTFVTPLLIALLAQAQEPRSRWCVILGHISYPLYLCQMPLILLADAVSASWNKEQLFFLSVLVAAATFALSWMVANWLEPKMPRMPSQSAAASGLTDSVPSLRSEDRSSEAPPA